MLLTASLAIPIGIGLGVGVSRLHSAKLSRFKVPEVLKRDYFLGLNYLINEQPDKAVDVFIKLLEVDKDTVETHLALGSLFRRRGEVDRAIRVHENIILRKDLSRQHRVEALSELGQDYLRAGVLDRAEGLFKELIELGDNTVAARRHLLSIYQQEKDWANAIEVATHLERASHDPMAGQIAHYYCELAEADIEREEIARAWQSLKRALHIDSHCVRASIISGRLSAKSGDFQTALRYYKQVDQQDPDFISEVIKPMTECYRHLNDADGMQTYFQDMLRKHPRISIALAIADVLISHQEEKKAIDLLSLHIQEYPSLRGLTQLVDIYHANAFGDTQRKLSLLKNLMEQVMATKPVYRCHHCGYSGRTLYWTCPSCHTWSSVKPIQGLEGA